MLVMGVPGVSEARAAQMIFRNPEAPISILAALWLLHPRESGDHKSLVSSSNCCFFFGGHGFLVWWQPSILIWTGFGVNFPFVPQEEESSWNSSLQYFSEVSGYMAKRGVLMILWHGGIVCRGH